MSKLSTYVFFDGNCAEAFRFYERALGGKIVISMTYAQMPAGSHPSDCPPLDPRHADKIMHVSLQVGNDVLMGADAVMGDPAHPGNAGYSIHLAVDDAARATAVFNALADGGTVIMPLDETFWAKRFGMVTDRFGIDWMISFGQA